MVVSINPFRELPIYNQETIDKYRGRSAFDPKLAPHMCVSEWEKAISEIGKEVRGGEERSEMEIEKTDEEKAGSK